MTGRAGTRVRVRFMPHHDHRIEVYHAATGRYLGPADLADQATDEQVSAVRRARSARARRPKKDLEASQRERYAAATQPEAPPAARHPDHRAGRGRTRPCRRHRPVRSGDAGPHPARRAPSRLAHPPSLVTRTAPGRPAPVPSEPAPGPVPGSTAQTTDADSRLSVRGLLIAVS
ncbi:Mu transposase C-terminal domain-containing protein [Streptomyces chrestomyceticus]|uniref:Mu transposase C-terminal domain-containing protein n=1 Tax=Streptomyces chrestomyceticus TaxID=68185 RepID=UPI0033E6ABB7